jgi:hypothetical protein
MRSRRASLSKSAGLLHREEGLAAAGATADLYAMDETNGTEDDGLMLGKRVGDILVGEGAGDNIALRYPLPLNAVVSCRIPSTVRSGRSISWRTRIS